MNDYRSTVNLPGQPRNTVASWPDSPRTAVLVGKGILIPAVRSMTEPRNETAEPRKRPPRAARPS